AARAEPWRPAGLEGPPRPRSRTQRAQRLRSHAMDFNDTPDEAAFRAEVRAWLAKNAPAHEGSMQEHRTSEDVSKGLARAKAWQALKADAGYVCITWPEEYGGRGGTPMQAVIYAEEEAKYS